MTSRFVSVILVLAAAACSSSSPTGNQGGNPPPPPPPPPPGGNVQAIAVSDGGFAPGGLTISAGATVRWSNGGVMAHTATSDTGVWDSGSMFGSTVDQNGYSTGGGTYERVFSSTGTFAYHCANHPTMTGTITVTP
jgi:plastocyanin